MKRLYLLAAALCFLPTGIYAQSDVPPEDPMQKSLKFERQITRTLRANYLLYLPKKYNARSDERWPLILFLHGAGERGSNIWKVTVHGPPKIVRNRGDFPFIVVSPQCPAGQRWSNDVLINLLEEIVREHAVDTNRIYLTGLSMGGFGTWSLAAEYPSKWAAIAPICGGGDVIPILLASKEKRVALQTLGVWAFHGAKDPVVKLEESEKMVDAFKKIGCKDIQLTVYPEAAHDSWTETYNNPALYEWFLKHERNAASEKPE